MKKRMLSALLCLCMMLTMVPAAFAVEGETGPSMTANVPKEFTVGVATEFSFTTHGTYNGGNVTGYSSFSDTSAFSALKYWDGAAWQDFPIGEDFGGGSGFQFTDGATSRFQITFTKPGNYTFEAYMKDVDSDTEVCSTGEISFVVKAADPVAEVDGIGYSTLEEAVAAVPEGGTVTLNSDIKVTSTIRITDKSLTLNMNEHKIYNESAVWNEKNNSWSLVSVGNGADLTITGAGTFQAKQNDCYAIDIVDGGICTIENGTFDGNISAVYVLEGDLVINGGTFSIQQLDTNKQYAFLLNCLDENYKNGTATITVNGGTFENFNPSACAAETADNTTNFCASGRKVTESTESGITIYTVKKLDDGQMVVNPVPSEDGSVSASLEGTYTSSTNDVEGSTGSGEPSGSVENSTVSVDLTPDNSNSATSASLNVAADTAKSMADNGAALEVKSNVGTLTVSNDALKTISGNAKNEAVTLSIAKGVTAEDDGTATYELTAQTADGTDVFTESAGIIEVSVPAPSGVTQDNVHVYYLGPNGAEDMEAIVEDGNVVWTVNHFSTYLVTATEQKVSVTVNGETNVYDDLTAALNAISDDDDDVVVNLMGNVSMTSAFTVGAGKTVTINGNNHVITGKADDASVGFVNNGTFNISNVTLEDFGSTAATDNGIAVIKVPDTASADAKVVADSVDISNFCRSAYDIRSGSFEITGGTIDCGSAYGSNSRLTKGIMAGYGSTKVTGTISNVEITNSASNYNDWSSAGIEVYKNADVTISGGSITNVENGIHVDNYYAVSGDGVVGADVTVENVTVEATNDAIRVYGGGADGTNNETASIVVNGGVLTGDIAVINGTTADGSTASKETIGVNSATVNGTIDNADGVMGFTNSTIINAGDGAALATGVTYVNTTVDGAVVNTSTEDEAMVNGVSFDTLEDAIAAAGDGDVVTLLNNVTLNGEGKTNTQGILTISEDITIEGNGKVVTAENVTVDGQNGPSMINVQNGADVVVNNLTIDGAIDGQAATKHGLNIYQATVSLNDVIIRNNRWYAVVANGSHLTVNGLTTTGNQWGINVDNEDGEASLTVESANISEASSIVLDKGNESGNAPVVGIKAGDFEYIVSNTDGAADKLTINGGKFATGDYENAVNIGDYVAEGMEWDQSTGEVVEESQNQGGNGGGGGGSSSSGYTVSVDSSIENGSIRVSPSRASRGDTVTITVDPDEGYELDTLTVTDANGNEIDVERQSDTRYTFEMPSGRVTVDATFAEVSETPETPDQVGSFVDVTTDDWFADAVQYMLDNGMMNGVTDTTFAPSSTTTRGMIVTILYRLEGEPDTAASSFTDVAANMYYADAVAWAQANSIVTGITETTFAPDQAITREQMAAILYRYAQYKGYDVTASNDLSSYTDASQISAYATTAMQWANAEGLITGNTDTTINPTGNATRAELATILMRFCENIAK